MSRSSDTIANYTRPGLDEDPAVLVVGDVDSHFFADGGFVCGVGAGECGGDVPEAGYQGFDVVSGECGTMLVTFDKADEPEMIICLISAHYEAGVSAELSRESPPGAILGRSQRTLLRCPSPTTAYTLYFAGRRI